jgi:hypothetical protein
MKGSILHLSKSFYFSDENYIDYEWIEAQMKYIDWLSDRKKHIIRAYTLRR